ncbi:SAM-dependent methyltransferase [Clostridia bacterium]|nr:SAM-dependent methyltransferase [Clostridia bacterium]
MTKSTEDYIKSHFTDTVKLILHSPRGKTLPGKITGTKILIGKKDHMQFEHISDKKAYHENIPIENLPTYFADKMNQYKQADIFIADSGESRATRHFVAFSDESGSVKYHKAKGESPALPVMPHDRTKQYLINEGDEIPVFGKLGIFTPDRRIVKGMAAKFRQINRFAELFNDMRDSLDKIHSKSGEIKLIDFGCGKGYLTFVLYHYLRDIRKYREDSISVVGIDLKFDVIENMNALAREYKYNSLHFEVGDINGYNPADKPDVVVSLHGCDTATDYALINAVNWGAKLIFSSPCCEHEVNKQLTAAEEGNATQSKLSESGVSAQVTLPVKKELPKPVAPLMYYGVVKERFASLLTNTIRCKTLEARGYSVELMEFVDISHTPKNLLIRAVQKTTHADDKAADEVKTMCEEYGINPSILRLLDEE